MICIVPSSTIVRSSETSTTQSYHTTCFDEIIPPSPTKTKSCAPFEGYPRQYTSGVFPISSAFYILPGTSRQFLLSILIHVFNCYLFGVQSIFATL